ncbi:MAG: gamma-glutamyltransferase [Thermodesulfobacteriota bacterium]
MKAVVSAGHELTARAAVEMLELGGNAFDAAVSAVFASFVTEAVLTSPAGGGFFIAHRADSVGDSSINYYDFFTNVPGRGGVSGKKGGDFNFPSVFINFANVRQELRIGEGSAAVPGVIAGLEKIYENFCTLPLEKLIAPAHRYATDGVLLNSWQAYFSALLSPMLGATEESLALFAPDGNFLKEGERFYNRDLARTLETFASDGLGSFYTGFIAEKILEGFSKKGLITEEDLTNYRAVERRPLAVEYRGRRIYTNPPPSSGGPLIAFALKLLQSFDVGAMRQNSVESLKLLREVMRVTELARRAELDHKLHHETVEAEFLSSGNVENYLKMVKEGCPDVSATGEPMIGNTTQISVIDELGNAAGMTTTTGIGSGVLIPGTGIMMNNMLGEEDVNPRGFHSGDPGARVTSMMAPTIVMKGELPELVLGSGGSKRIRSAILQVILNIVDHDMKIDEAVNSSRAHYDGEFFHVEEGMDSAVLTRLAGVVKDLNIWNEKNLYFGGAHTVRDEAGLLTGAGDKRRGGVSLKAEN